MIAALLLSLLSRPAIELGSATFEPVVDLGDTTKQSVNLEVLNNLSAPLQVWHAAFWQNHRLELYSLTGSRVPKTPTGQSNANRFGGARDHNVPFVIPKGGSHTYATPRLPEHFVLSPGKYWLHVKYEDKSFGKPLKLSAHPFLIRVTN